MTKNELVLIGISIIFGVIVLIVDAVSLIKQENILALLGSNTNLTNVYSVRDTLNKSCSEAHMKVQDSILIFEGFDCHIDVASQKEMLSIAFDVVESHSYRSTSSNKPWLFTGIWFFIVGLLLTKKIIKS